jgi:hypothetical protein
MFFSVSKSNDSVFSSSFCSYSLPTSEFEVSDAKGPDSSRSETVCSLQLSAGLLKATVTRDGETANSFYDYTETLN